MTRALIPPLLAILLGPTVALGNDDPIKPKVQELFLGARVYPQERHELQLTAGSTLDRGDRQSTFSVPIGVEYGLTDRWEIGAGLQSFTYVRSLSTPVSSVGGLSVETKYSFMNLRGSNVHVALGTELELPNRWSESRGEGAEASSYVVVASELFGARAEIFGQLSATAASAGDDGGEDELHASPVRLHVGGLVPAGALTFGTEIMLQRAGPGTLRTSHVTVAPSITLSVTEAWQIGAGVRYLLRAGRPGFAVHAVYER